MNKKFKIGIIGIGMVGTPLKKYFLEVKKYKQGINIFLYDADPKKNYQDDINQADIIFIAVPTPKSTNGAANLSILDSALKTINSGKIAVIKSTIPPGTTENLQKKYPGLKIMFNPEFLTEQNAWQDFIKPSRQIVGFLGNNVKVARDVLNVLPKAKFMSPSGNGQKSIKVSATEAELIKYAGNVYLTRKINFANVLAAAADKLGADYRNVRKGMSADLRIGQSHLDVDYGGYRGFGGYCFPKDLDAFVAALESYGLENCAGLLREDREFNKKLLASQGLTVEEVSVHDHEWIKNHVSDKKTKK